MTGKKINAGLDLIERGFSIFPIKEGAKHPPLVKNWPARASNDPDQINAWAEKYPGCNWGIHCKGMVVLDVDPKHGGVDSLDVLGMVYDIPSTLTAETPSGGHHLFYMGGSAPNGANVHGPGVDVRSDNGYVVAPGSRLENGEYRWRNPDRGPAAVQPWMLMSKQRQAEVLKEAPETVKEEGALALAQKYLAAAEVPASGNRDHGLIPVAAQLKDYGVPFEVGLHMMETWAKDMDLTDFPYEQFVKCVRQGYKTDNAAGSKSHEAIADEFSDLPAEVPTRVEALDDELYTPYDVGLADVTGNDYLVKGWLDKGSRSMMFGRWGAGKTFTIIDACAHIAAGNEWFGQRVKQGSVLYLGYEGAVSMKRRLFALREEYSDWDWESIPFYIRHMTAPLVVSRARAGQGKPKGAAILERVIKNIKQMDGEFPSLVVIDPLRDALGGSDSDVDYTQPYIEYTKRLVEKLGCALLTLHHPGHGEAERSRGDSGLEAAMDSVIRLDGDLGKIASTKQRDSVKSALYYTLRVVEVARDADGDPVTTCVVDQVSDNDMDPALTATQRTFLGEVEKLVNDEGFALKSRVNRVGDFEVKVRTEIISTLERKGYLVLEGTKGYRIGEGPGIEEFN